MPPKKKAPAKKTEITVKPRPAPKVGATAPAFTLPSDAGEEISLRSLKGKNVVLYFYPKDSTPGCTVEACGFRDASQELAGHDAVVLGVSRDSIASHQKFKAKYELDFPLLSDPSAETIAAYGSWGEKTFMGRKSVGILRTTVIIDKAGKVAKVFSKVNTKTHAADVLAALAALN